MEMPEAEVLGAAAAVIALLVFLVATGLGRLVLLFTFILALTLAMEALVFLGLSLVAPEVMEVGLAQGLNAWALLPALIVAFAVTFHAWREGL